MLNQTAWAYRAVVSTDFALTSGTVDLLVLDLFR